MTNKTISILGAPLDLGAGHRGVDAGPSAFRIAGLQQALEAMKFNVVDEGNLDIEIPEKLEIGDPKARFLKEITTACERQHTKVKEVLEKGNFPLILGGDHSIAIGTVAGVSSYYKDKGQDIGLIWVDAHADMNTAESTVSGNIHGMPLSSSLGLGLEVLTHIGGYAPKVKPQNVVLIGIRDLDVKEKELVKQTGVRAYTMTDIDELGMPTVIRQAIEVAGSDTAGIHLSFDFDGLDPDIAPGVGTPVKGGIRYREAHLLMEKIALTGRMIGLEMVELNPILDMANKTAELGVELIESAFGKRIL